jgi:phosphatidylserine/phosphatidylglycerophosphate/cardiolipin synthase-like enzyme
MPRPTTDYPNHMILGAPADFRLETALRSAASIKIATAFATAQGWRSIERAIEQRNLSVELLVGLSGGITDPPLLAEWLRTAEENPRGFLVSVAPMKPMFHPKVLIVEMRKKGSFAIVGSGNLTGKGQTSNIECGVYLKDPDMIAQLSGWFASLNRTALNEKIVHEYRNWSEAIRSRPPKASGRLEELLRNSATGEQPRYSATWRVADFVHDLNVFARKEGMSDYEGRRKDADRIEEFLKLPACDFSKTGWDDFKKMPAFGPIRLAYPQQPEQIPKLQGIVRTLTSPGLTL